MLIYITNYYLCDAGHQWRESINIDLPRTSFSSSAEIAEQFCTNSCFRFLDSDEYVFPLYGMDIVYVYMHVLVINLPVGEGRYIDNTQTCTRADNKSN